MSTAALKEAAAQALAEARRNPTPENRASAVEASAAASAAISAAGESPKGRGYGCKAGRRQHAEQHARTAESLRRFNARPR